MRKVPLKYGDEQVGWAYVWEDGETNMVFFEGEEETKLSKQARKSIYEGMMEGWSLETDI